MIQPSDRCIDLIDAIKLILDFNERIENIKQKIKTRWILIAWRAKKKILKILTKINRFHYDDYCGYYDDFYDYCDV